MALRQFRSTASSLTVVPARLIPLGKSGSRWILGLGPRGTHVPYETLAHPRAQMGLHAAGLVPKVHATTTIALPLEKGTRRTGERDRTTSLDAEIYGGFVTHEGDTKETRYVRETSRGFRPPRELGRKDGRACVEAHENAAATGVIVAKVGDPPGNI